MITMKDMYVKLADAFRMNTRQSYLRFAICQVNGELAEKWLKCNTRNRRLNKRTYSSYASDMETSGWLFDASPIKFDTEGKLQDGQHRLMAIVASDVTIDLLVVMGLPPETFTVQDIGRVRSFTDVVGVEGYMNPGTLSGITRMCWMYSQDQWKTLKSDTTRLNPSTLLVFLRANPAIIESTRFVASLGASVIRPMISGPLHWVFAQRDPKLAKSFVERLVRGTGLEPSDPLLTLRSRISEAVRRRQYPKKDMVVSAIIRAWNYERQGLEASYVRLEPRSSIETIL